MGALELFYMYQMLKIFGIFVSMSAILPELVSVQCYLLPFHAFLDHKLFLCCYQLISSDL